MKNLMIHAKYGHELLWRIACYELDLSQFFLKSIHWSNEYLCALYSVVHCTLFLCLCTVYCTRICKSLSIKVSEKSKNFIALRFTMLFRKLNRLWLRLENAFRAINCKWIAYWIGHDHLPQPVQSRILQIIERRVRKERIIANTQKRMKCTCMYRVKGTHCNSNRSIMWCSNPSAIHDSVYCRWGCSSIHTCKHPYSTNRHRFALFFSPFVNSTIVLNLLVTHVHSARW